jgi:energy-coupling factor transport system permease protein
MNLNEMNPSIKALSIVICILLLSLFFDPVTPLLSIIMTTAITFVFGKVSVRKWLIMFSPFLFMAIVYVWSSILFPRVDQGDHIIGHWGLMTITAEGLERSISLGLRVLSFASLSLLFALSTNPVDFLLSLMQQCKLSPKIAYSIMAGYQFLPLIKEEMDIIRSAHQVRGAGRAQTFPDKIRQIKKYAIPLLASGIRKAERTAMAMESKGFTGEKERIYYRVIRVSYKDWLFLCLLISVIGVSAFISYKLGYLAFYTGEL